MRTSIQLSWPAWMRPSSRRFRQHGFMDRLLPIVEPIAQDSGWNPCDDCVGRHITGHDGAGPDDRPVADGHSSYEDSPMSHQHIGADPGYTRRRATGKHDRGTGFFTVVIAPDDRDIGRERRVVSDVNLWRQLTVRTDVHVVARNESRFNIHRLSNVKAFPDSSIRVPQPPQEPGTKLFELFFRKPPCGERHVLRRISPPQVLAQRNGTRIIQPSNPRSRERPIHLLPAADQYPIGVASPRAETGVTSDFRR